MFRHLSGQTSLFWSMEGLAWRTLEDVLRLAPVGKEPPPSLDIPELLPLVRQVRQEQALLGMILPAFASQPSPVIEQKRGENPWAALALEAAIVPARVFLIPDELVAMRKLLEDYHQSPRSAREETPKDWADLRQSVETERSGIYSVIWMKPKHQVLVAGGSALAALRQTGRTGLAVEAYRRQHGQYPERLEQLVPEFLPAVPVDPRDGQPLRIKRVAGGVVLYAHLDSEATENRNVGHPEDDRPPPIFRLFAPPPRQTP
jgi:hypothetical protein